MLDSKICQVQAASLESSSSVHLVHDIAEDSRGLALSPQARGTALSSSYNTPHSFPSAFHMLSEPTHWSCLFISGRKINLKAKTRFLFIEKQ